jgi:AAA15 family ATPase/GTPase
MITRVEISGFKTFTDFSVDLAPLSVIAGANASGKSNFLDALRIVQGITAGKSLDNILDGRGNASHFFTKFDEHKKSTVMSIAVELLQP